MPVSSIETFLDTDMPQIEGWLSGSILLILAQLQDIMDACDVKGGAAEIGVYQGKFIIGLSHLVDGKTCLALDVFDNQDLNIDNSGGGKTELLNKFLYNVEKFGAAPIDYIVEDSLSLTAVGKIDILSKFGTFRYFSVDGGHEPEHLINDYKVAEEMTHSGGVIVIDDALNAGWPGVFEGIAYLFVSSRPKFVPLVIGHNKLILVGKTYHQKYFDYLVDSLRRDTPFIDFWKKRLFGHAVISLI